MSGAIAQRVLALAGLAQALKQVRKVAETGQADNAILSTALDSIFRIDAATAEAVYGHASALRPGMRLLAGYLRNQADDQLLPRLSLAVIQLERRFTNNRAMAAQVHAGILAAAPLAHNLGTTHPEVLAALGKLYAETISQLRPRVMVQGNPHYLGQAGVVAEIRAILLAALRSAVLWRQLGGSLWDFLLQRRTMIQTIEERFGG